MRALRAIYAAWVRWYDADIERQRHRVEADCLRLGGRVTWGDER